MFVMACCHGAYKPKKPGSYVAKGDNRRADRIKILLWDRNGFWLLLKRLEKDRFAWPRLGPVAELSVEQLHWLLEGIDIEAVRRHPERVYHRAN